LNTALAENPVHVEELCARLGIGNWRGEIPRVYGGFHHRVWRLGTDRGDYAVKQLCTDADLSHAEALTNHYNATEYVAESFAVRGIAAIHALKGASVYLQVVGNTGYLVYPWTDALALGRDEIEERHAGRVAQLMAEMHRAGVDFPALPALQFDIHPEDAITDIVRRARACNAVYTGLLEEQLGDFREAVQGQRPALWRLNRRLVVSHGDLDHKNVLWDAAGNPSLIDWESARRLNPTYELVLEALDWSGISSRFAPGMFREFLRAYQEAGGLIDAGALADSFQCILGDWTNWLMYNVGLSVEFADEERRSAGAAQVDLALSTFMRIRRLLPALRNMAEDEIIATC